MVLPIPSIMQSLPSLLGIFCLFCGCLLSHWGWLETVYCDQLDVLSLTYSLWRNWTGNPLIKEVFNEEFETLEETWLNNLMLSFLNYTTTTELVWFCIDIVLSFFLTRTLTIQLCIYRISLFTLLLFYIHG